MRHASGHRIWAIPEGYIPGRSVSQAPDLISQPYSSVIRSSVPVLVQHTRLDSRDPHIALLSTMAMPLES